MKFQMYHTNITVLDMDRSLAFYNEALGLEVVREINAEDGSYKIAFLGHPGEPCQLEITWYADRTEPWNLGDNEVHTGFRVADEDYEAALAKHKEMGCVCFENTDMGIYFIEDPDGYWMEVVPARGEKK